MLKIPDMNAWTVIVITVYLHSLVVGADKSQLVFTVQLLSKPPFYQGQTLLYQSLVKHKLHSNETAENVTVDWTLPSYTSYKSYISRPSAKTPTEVSSNANQITMKFGSVSPSEKIDILMNVTIDPSDTFRDNRFHYATISSTLKYRWPDPCVTAATAHQMLHFPFFCPECSIFGTLGMINGNIRDSQIQASTIQMYGSSNKAWKPMTSFHLLNVKRQMKFNFLQIDLRFSRQVDMVVIDGIPKNDPIPWNIVQLSFSENSWKWKTRKNIQNTEIFKGQDVVVVAITTLKPIKTRYLRINVPPYGFQNGRNSIYKVQLYGCNPTDTVSQDLSAVGIESSSLVPDSQFSSPSSLDLQHKPHLGRLNTKVDGGSWCASKCSPFNYLQIDLGDTWRISEIENQGRHTTDGTVIAVKTYSLSSRLDGASWTPYKINGGAKIFWGNDIAHLATRHKLFKPITANHVRFEPRTCVQNACMRVELYGTKASVIENKVLPVVFGRSMLINKADNIAFVCNSEVKKGKAHCFSSKDKGKSWQGKLENNCHQKKISIQVLSILAFNSNEQRLYGLTLNGKNVMKSKDSSGTNWRGIPIKEWYSVRDRTPVIIAEEIPFVPISRNVTNTIEPLVQMTTFSGDKWQADQIGVYYKPNSGTTKMVLSFLPYPHDLSSNPCHTGVCVNGECKHQGGSQFTCHCKPGYTGRFCDTAINYCSVTSCHNGGTCSPLFLSFSCSCQLGYSGSRCQDYNECISNPCQNGGTCFDGDNEFNCTCPVNYRGTKCEDFDDCSSSPCLYGGTCTDGGSSYTCSCLTGYTGQKCEVTPCTINPCRNGGTCRFSSGGGFTCGCDVYHSGTICANGNFVMGRGARSPSAVWSYSSGKFDKIVFFSNANLTIFGICISDTFSSRDTPCPFETRIRKEGSTNILASTSGTVNCKINNKYVNCPQFTNPLRILAGTRYIIEVRMSSSANIRKVVNGISTLTKNFADGSLSVTYSYETVSAAELADSNGSTQSEGGIIGLSAQFTHD